MTPAPSYSMIADDMRAVDAVIRARLHSEVVLVRQVAEYIIAAGGIRQALAQARKIANGNIFVQIEVESTVQLVEALECGATMVLLDNMTPEQLREAVVINAGRAELEVSGGVSIDRVRAIAETGVERIAVGAITHSAPILDIGLDALA